LIRVNGDVKGGTEKNLKLKPSRLKKITQTLVMKFTSSRITDYYQFLNICRKQNDLQQHDYKTSRFTSYFSQKFIPSLMFFFLRIIARRRASSVHSISPLRSSPSALFIGPQNRASSVLFRVSSSVLFVFGPLRQAYLVLVNRLLRSSPSALFGPHHRFTKNINWSQNRASIIWMESHAFNNNVKAIELYKA
jgi:hypothetical protein